MLLAGTLWHGTEHRRTKKQFHGLYAHKQESRTITEAGITPFKGAVLIITVDSGNNRCGAKVYFADSNCLWQRGSNENNNGL